MFSYTHICIHILHAYVVRSRYNYSIFCSTFAITLVYAIPHPPILFLGLMYSILRAFGDKYDALSHARGPSIYFANKCIHVVTPA